MEQEILEQIGQIAIGLKRVEEILNKRIDKIKDVLYSYLEYGSSIGLSSIKANLKSV